MLLFVIEAQLDQSRCLFPNLVAALGDESQQCTIDMLPIGQNLVDAGAGDHAALRPWLARPEALVVGVEKVGVALVERPVTGGQGSQNHRFKKPGSVGEVPFGRAGIGHSLQALILRRQRLRQLFRQVPYRPKTGRHFAARR